jgi:hypothetical protein
VTPEPTIESREPKLSAIGALRVQVEPSRAQPGGHDVLGAVAGFEDAECLRLELAALVLWDAEIIVLNLPEAFATEPGRADVAAG